MAIARYATYVNGNTLSGADLNGIQDVLVNAATGIDNSVVTGTEGSANELAMWNADGDLVGSGITAGEAIIVACSDEATALVAATSVVKFRMPYSFTLSAVRASLGTASSSGVVTVDINESGSTILSVKLTIDANEKTSTTAATTAVISDTELADDAEITIDIDDDGTGAAGLKVTLLGKRGA